MSEISEMEKVTFKTIHKEGSNVVSPLPFVSCVVNYLELMSMLTKKSVSELQALLVLPSQKDESIELVLQQKELFEGAVGEQIGYLIIEVGKAVFEDPNNIDYSVFERLNIEPKDYDKIVEIVNKDRPFYKRLGLNIGKEIKAAYLQRVTPYLKDLNANVQVLVDIAGVMDCEQRRHANFFVYRNEELQLKRYKNKPKILVCEIDSDMAKALLKLTKDKENGNVSIAIFITIKKKAKGNVHELVSIDDRKQQFQVTYAEKLNISN